MHILLLQSEFKSVLNTKTTKTNGKIFNHNLFKFNDIKKEEKSKREEKTRKHTHTQENPRYLKIVNYFFHIMLVK